MWYGQRGELGGMHVRRRGEGTFFSGGMRHIHWLAILLLYFFGQYILISVIKSFNNPSPSCIGITVQPHIHGREQAITDCAVLLLNLLESGVLHFQLYSHGFHLTPGDTVQSQSQLPQLRFSVRHDKFSYSGLTLIMDTRLQWCKGKG